ncbi:MAG: hypothetical protein IJO70_08315 [Lachnospiraceae bacterium]|nr:hypothetical protein [Lachnospiraceae bacterium]
MGNKGKSNEFTFVVMFIVAIVFLFILKNDFKYIFTGETRDVYEIISSGEELKKGEHVSVELIAVVDWYAELTESRRGVKSITYHAMGVLEDGTVISICTKKDSKEYRLVDKLVNDTYSYLEGSSYTLPEHLILKGSVQGIDSEISPFYSEALKYYGYSSNEVIYLDINTRSTRGGMIVAFIITLILFVVPIFALVVEIISYKNKKLERELERNTPISNIDPANDPIFNKSFYDRIDSFKDNSETEDILKENELNSNINVSKEDITDVKSTTSKFSLKKDD